MSQLDDANRQIDTDPQKAFATLLNIDTLSFATSKEKALYSLLFTLAQLKTGNDSIPYSSLKYACEYYNKDLSPSREKMLTHFAMGAIHSNNGENAKAITEFERAISCADGPNADVYKALAHLNMASIYNESFSYPEERENIDKGLKIIESTHDTTNIIHGLLVSGISYNGNGQYTKAKEDFEKALELSSLTQSKTYHSDISKQMAYTQSLLGNHTFAIAMFDSILSDPDISLSDSEFAAYIRSLSLSGNNQRAEMTFHSLRESGSDLSAIDFVYTESIIHANNNNFKMAYETLLSSLGTQNTVIDNKLDSNIIRDQKNMALENEKILEELAFSRKRLFIVSILAGTLATCIVVIIFVNLIKKYKRMAIKEKHEHAKQLDNLNKLLTEVENNYTETELENTKLSSALESMHKDLKEMQNRHNQMQITNDSLNESISKLENKIQQYEVENNRFIHDSEVHLKTHQELSSKIALNNEIIDLLRSQLMNNFRNLHGSASSFCNEVPKGISSPDILKLYEIQKDGILLKYTDKSFISTIETQIDQFMDGIISYCRDTNILNDDEVLILIYELCGFNYRSMSILMNINQSAMATRRSRLKSKIVKRNFRNDYLDKLKHNCNLFN